MSCHPIVKIDFFCIYLGGHLMHHQIIKSTVYFQHLLFSSFRCIKSKVVDTLLLLSVCHLFGLYNPNQVADELALPKTSLYREFNSVSLYHWKCFNVRLGCAAALEFIKDTVSKRASTQSRRCPTISVDDTNVDRYGKMIAYCSNWWSKKHHKSIWCQNVLAITIKIGDIVIPLNTQLVSKQGRGNTDKPSLFIVMINDVLDFFDAHGIDIRAYPITFDSWYGSKKLVNILLDLGFVSVMVHGKSNYVMTIGNKTEKLSVHKKKIQLQSNQWGCDKPVCRVRATSPTFGECIVLFFFDMGKIRTLLVFGKPLRTCEALRIWSQHHGIEHFWRQSKSILHLSDMSLQSTEGAYAGLGIKVLSYLILLHVSILEQRTFHQGQLELTGQRHMLLEIMTHFHELNAKEP